MKRLNRCSHVITTLTVMLEMEWTELAENMGVYVEKSKLLAHQLVGRLKPHGVDELIESLKVISIDHEEEGRAQSDTTTQAGRISKRAP